MEELSPYEKLLESRLSQIDWILNKLVEFDKRKSELKGILVKTDITATAKGFIKPTFSIFVTRPWVTKDKNYLVKIARILNIGYLKKTTTSQGFTKLIGFYEGVRVNVFTHWCFEKGHVKVVDKAQRTKAITRCLSRDEALKLAKEQGYVIEE